MLTNDNAQVEWSSWESVNVWFWNYIWRQICKIYSSFFIICWDFLWFGSFLFCLQCLRKVCNVLILILRRGVTICWDLFLRFSFSFFPSIFVLKWFWGGVSLAAPAGGAERALNAQQPGKIKTSKAIYFDQISESWQAQNVFVSIVDCICLHCKLYLSPL